MPNQADTEVDGQRGGEWYRRLVSAAGGVTLVVAPDGMMTYVSPGAESMLGYSSEHLTGETVEEYVRPTDNETVEETITALQASPEKSRRIDVRFRCGDDSWCWLEARLVDRLDDDVLGGIVVTVRDVTERREREATLRTTKERMKMALEGANLGIWDWDMESDEVTRDELLTEMLGYTTDEMGDHLQGWERVVHPEGKRRHDEALAEHIEDRTPHYHCEYRLETKSGDWKWVRTMGKVVERDDDGTPLRAVGIHQDIDDRKRAELALEQERDMFREGPAVVFEWDDVAGWPIEYVSENVTDVLGYERERLLSMDFADLVHEEDLQQLTREIADQREEESDRLSPTPYRVRTADGDVRWVLEHTRAFDDANGDARLLGYLVDITERKRRERELQQFKEAVERSAHAIYITDADGTIEYVNPAFEEVTGYSEQEAVGQTPWILKSGAHDEANYEAFWETITEGEQWKAESVDERADGTEVVLNQTVAPITSEDGEVRKFVAVAQDITERKTYEEKLAEREQKYRRLFEDTRDALMLFDRDGYLDCNEQALELFGIDSVEAFRQYTPWELSPTQQPDGADSEQAARERIETAFEEGKAFFEWTHQRVDGTNFPSEVKLSRFEHDGEPVIHALVRDISDRKAQERELQAREAKYRNLFEDTRDALMLLDRDGFFDCNQTTLELFDIDSVEAFTEYTPWDLSPERQSDGTDSETLALEYVETAFEEGEAFFEWTHERVDGTTFPAEVKLSRFEYEEEPALHALVRDITDRKEYERQIEAQRDNLDVLNQVLRHDIRNDIQLITAHAELLASKSEDDDVLGATETILENATHAVELTASAREMAAVMLSTDEELSEVGLRIVLESELDEVQSAYPEAAVTAETTVPSVTVQANDMLGSVFRNLLKNAIQHNDKEIPEVTVSATEREETVVVRVADNGPGVPDAQKESIFGKGEKGLDSQGTGIGLYLVKTLVESYDGDIWVEDRSLSGADEQTGAVFVLELPRAE